jgi:hypothetical protein
VKCDEEKPQCVRCLKSGQACIYGIPDQTSTPRVESRAFLSSTSATGEKRIIQQHRASEQRLQSSAPGSDPGVGFPATTIHPNSRDTDTQNDLNRVTSRDLTSGTTEQQAFCPVGLPVYADTPISLGTGDSLVTVSTLSQPTLNTAISRWFDMLVGDWTFYNDNPDFDVDGFNEFNTTQHQERDVMPPTRAINATDDTISRQPGSPSSSSPQLLERSAVDIDRNSGKEKSRWQSPGRIDLLPHEHNIFHNFVGRISRWVPLVYPFQKRSCLHHNNAD